jgi:hypothetical protein
MSIFDVPQQFVASVEDWINYDVEGGLSVKITHMMQVSPDRLFVVFDTAEDERKCLVLFDRYSAQTCLWFNGYFDHMHLSRSKKSLVVFIDERHLMNGEPYVRYHYQRSVWTLEGKRR